MDSCAALENKVPSAQNHESTEQGFIRHGNYDRGAVGKTIGMVIWKLESRVKPAAVDSNTGVT